MKLYREQILIETLLKFRLRKYDFKKIKVECYNHFDGDTTKCRLEVYKNGDSIEHRLLKHEAELSETFIQLAEKRIEALFVGDDIN